MITRKELLQAIDECERDPVNYNSCEKLANFYIIYEHLYGEKQNEQRTAKKEIIELNSGTGFAEAVNGKNADHVLAVIDELMSVLEKINPRLYDGVLRKIEE